MENGSTLNKAVSGGGLEGLETLNGPEGTLPRRRTFTDETPGLIGKIKFVTAFQNNIT